MYTYLIKRLLMVIPTLLGAAILVFFLMRMIPGDVCQLKLAGSGAFFDQRSLDICRLELGLDEPIFLQFFQWVGGWFVGDFGTSMWTGKPVSEELAVRFQVSLQNALLSTLFAVILSIPLCTAPREYPRIGRR